MESKYIPLFESCLDEYKFQTLYMKKNWIFRFTAWG